MAAHFQRKTYTKNKSSPEPTQITIVGPSVGFIRGLIQFSTLISGAYRPKKTLCVSTSKPILPQMNPRGHPGGALWDPLGPFGATLGRPWLVSCPCLGARSPLLGRLGPFGAPLGRPWPLLWLFFGARGAFLGLLGPFCASFRRPWPLLRPFLGPRWPRLGLTSASLGFPWTTYHKRPPTPSLTLPLWRRVCNVSPVRNYRKHSVTLCFSRARWPF